MTVTLRTGTATEWRRGGEWLPPGGAGQRGDSHPGRDRAEHPVVSSCNSEAGNWKFRTCLLLEFSMYCFWTAVNLGVGGVTETMESQTSDEGRLLCWSSDVTTLTLKEKVKIAAWLIMKEPWAPISLQAGTFWVSKNKPSRNTFKQQQSYWLSICKSGSERVPVSALGCVNWGSSTARRAHSRGWRAGAHCCRELSQGCWPVASAHPARLSAQANPQHSSWPQRGKQKLPVTWKSTTSSTFYWGSSRHWSRLKKRRNNPPLNGA